MSTTTTPVNVRVLLAIAVALAPELGAQGPEPGFYQLHPDSSALVGCLDLCDCLLREVPDLSGSFSVEPIDGGALFTRYAVHDMVLTLGTDPPVTVLAAGTLEARFGDDALVYETFELEVTAGSEAPELFRSQEPRLREEPLNEIRAVLRPAALVCEGQVFIIRAVRSEENAFVRSDCNADGTTDIGDAIFLLLHLFGGGVAPPCEAACDANRDETLNIADASAMLGYLFSRGLPPPPPFPACGRADSTLSCLSFTPCR